MSYMRKALVGLAIPVIGAVGLIVDSSATNITSHEWVALAVAVLTGLGVYVTPNSPSV